MLVRPAVGYRLRPNVSVWLGYGWTPLFEPEFASEHRIFQQLLVDNRLGATDITNRTRLEERFIQGAGDTSFRLRQMLRLSHPLDRARKWAIVAYDELFWNLNSTPAGPTAGFDQNRVFLGFSRVISPKLRLEAGYLWNFVDAPRAGADRNLDVFVTGLFYRW